MGRLRPGYLQNPYCFGSNCCVFLPVYPNVAVSGKAPLSCPTLGVGTHGCQDHTYSCLASIPPRISQKGSTSPSHQSEGSAREGNGEGLRRQLWSWGEMLGQHGLARLAGPAHGSMESTPCVGLTMRPAGCHANPGSALAPTITKYAQNHLKRFSGTPCAYKHETDCQRVRPEPNCSSRVPSGRLQNGGSLRAPSRLELQLPAAPAPRPARWESGCPAHSATFFFFSAGGLSRHQSVLGSVGQPAEKPD